MTRTKSIAILQSNYIPWKGYLDIIAAVDEFVIFDEVQFTRRDWRNRNKIVIAGKIHWLTIPVLTRGAFEIPINKVRVADATWARKHWTSICHAYGKARHFKTVAPALEDLYDRAGALEMLTEVNELMLKGIAGLIGLSTPMSRSDVVPRSTEDPTARLVELCAATGATDYLSGPAAKAYIKKPLFDAANIALHFADYSGYPEYDQQMTPFEHGVSAVDLLMRCGPAAIDHLKTTRARDTFCRPA